MDRREGIHSKSGLGIEIPGTGSSAHPGFLETTLLHLTRCYHCSLLGKPPGGGFRRIEEL